MCWRTHPNDMYSSVLAYAGASVTPETGMYDTKTVKATRPRKTQQQAPRERTPATRTAFSLYGPNSRSLSPSIASTCSCALM
jgi:hypothetical protein